MMESSSRKRGGILVIVDSPPGIEFGIDCMTYETGPKFRGISMIPAGLHFVYHSSGMCPRYISLRYDEDNKTKYCKLC